LLCFEQGAVLGRPILDPGVEAIFVDKVNRSAFLPPIGDQQG
jgi:hypothetical protein